MVEKHTRELTPPPPPSQEDNSPGEMTESFATIRGSLNSSNKLVGGMPWTQHSLKILGAGQPFNKSSSSAAHSHYERKQ
jgi:hypothetical protein